jgi:H+-transporting ATPase
MPDFKSATCEETLRILRSDAFAGLTNKEAHDRLGQYGPNQTPEIRRNPALLFLKKFWGMTAWMLEFTMVIALLRHRMLDVVIVGALLILNGILGFAQEQRASQAVEALKKRLQIWARVLREKAWQRVEAAALVPGDIIRLRGGDLVPADVKVLSGTLEADLSAITGESQGQVADAGDLLSAGAVVRRGEANAVTVLTGAHTIFGKTAQLVQVARPKLHFENVISKVVQWRLLMVGTLLILTVLIEFARHGEFLEILPLMLILLVSAIPVALPAMFTATLALGSMELVKKGILITRLNASEDAARMDVLCSDKTGTLTMNQLTVAQIQPAGGYKENDVVLYGSLCSQEANQDPIDLAFLREAEKRGLSSSGWRCQSFTPFDPATRRTEAVVTGSGEVIRVLKGSLESVIGLCEFCDDSEKARLRSWAGEFAEKGYRTLAVAREEQGRLRLVGLAVLYDSPRSDSKQVIQKLRELGVRVKMLTGDALPVAREIARELGLGEKLFSFKEVKTTRGVPSAQEVDAANGFAEIYPEDKYRIVQSLQEKGHVVGMTGDGVNDAPALKQAEVGVAMENATDVAKGAASVVLTREGLSALPDLIQVGRSIHQRVETWILNKIIKTFQTVVLVVTAFLVTGKFIVSTFDMVLLLFLVDFVTVSLATDKARGSQAPAQWNVSHLVRTGLQMGVFSVLEALGLLWIGWRYYDFSQHPNALHTFGFEILLYFGLFTVLVVREKGPFWSSWPSWPLLSAIGSNMILAAVLASVGVPGLKAIPIQATLLVIGYSFGFVLLINDLLKRSLFQNAIKAL